MEITKGAWKEDGAAQQPGEGQVALKAASHRILLLGVLYATTIIVVLMIVSRL